ncbi:HyaD/HybD family hydrogenase maturation endopeptidase, partial [Salmonella enterica]|nr:HyaD/HybD family hydrogenase maturation endopeptidase [Salmonella enterica]
MAEVTILGLGNLLWADEGFGVRAAEKLFEQYADNERVDVVDGGTQGLALLPWLQQTEKLLIMDAIDFGMSPGSLATFRDEQVPAYLTAKKLSLHQTSFSEVLALLQLTGSQLAEIVLIGVQPECLDDYGGSLTPRVKAQLMPAVSLAQEVLAQWGISASSAS